MVTRQRYRKMAMGGDPVKPVPVTFRNSTYKVDPNVIYEIASNAKGARLDPNTSLAIAFQESGIDSKNPYHLNPDYFPTNLAGPNEGISSVMTQMNYAKNLQSRGVIPQGEDYTIQGYNGYGTIKRSHADLEGATKIYGQNIPASGINLRKNPLYGKRVIDVRENAIKNNQQVQQIVDQALPLYRPHDTVIKQTRKSLGGRLIKPFS